MQELYSIIRSLTKPQIKIFRSYLTYMSVRKDESNKQLELANLLLKSKLACPTEEVCSQKIYGEKESYTIHQLKRRLRTKILDVLTMDINALQKGNMDEADYVSAKLKKKLLQFHVLYRTNANLIYNKLLLDDIITEAKEYEIYDALISALTYRKYFKGFCKGLKQFKEINKQIAFYEYVFTVCKKVNDYYYQLTMWDSFSHRDGLKKKQVFIQKCIIDMKKDYKYTKSAIVLYYLKLMEMAYFENYGEYDAARSASIELLEILRKNKAIYRKQRIGIAHDNIAYFDIYLQKHKAAAFNFQSAQQYFPVNSANYPLSKEYELQALFYAGDLKNAEACAKQLLKSTRFTQGDFRLAKYRFYHAAVLFKKGDYKKALQTLNEKFEISKDKPGWCIGVQLLTIMCNIELERKDKAFTEVETLRKHIQSTEKAGIEIRERDKIITRLLTLLAVKGFSQNAFTPAVHNLYTQLASDDKHYAWQPLTPELIPFNTWLGNKYNIKTKITLPALKKSRRELVLR